MTTPKLALFDFDGTIATKGVVSPSVLAGLRHLRDNGCITTISTGRGYVRLKEVLGETFDEVVAPDAILILEHGSKLVDAQGNIIFGEFLSPEEIDHIIDFVRANIELFRLAWFNPEDVNRKIPLWCADEQDVDAEIAARGHYAEVFTGSLEELHQALCQERLTNVTFKLRNYVRVENLKLSFTRTATNVIFQDGNMEFLRANINKGLAVLKVLHELQIAKEDTLLAGNAINDVEMLDIGAGTAILVGPEAQRSQILPYLSDPTALVTVDSPDQLGDYLQQA